MQVHEIEYSFLSFQTNISPTEHFTLLKSTRRHCVWANIKWCFSNRSDDSPIVLKKLIKKFEKLFSEKIFWSWIFFENKIRKNWKISKISIVIFVENFEIFKNSQKYFRLQNNFSLKSFSNFSTIFLNRGRIVWSFWKSPLDVCPNAMPSRKIKKSEELCVTDIDPKWQKCLDIELQFGEPALNRTCWRVPADAFVAIR